MKKILCVFLFFSLLLTACTKTVEPVNNGNDVDVVTDQSTPFPYEELSGYWLAKEGGDYLKIYSSGEAYAFSFGDFNAYDSGEAKILIEEDKGDGKYYFKFDYLEMSGLQGEMNIDISKAKEGTVEIDGKTYVYVGMDEYQASLANDDLLFEGFMKDLEGYWNADEDNVFLSLFESDGIRQMIRGRYDSEPGPNMVIDKVTKNGSVYTVSTYRLNDPSITNEYKIDVSDLADLKLLLDGEAYHFAGKDFNEAYEDYAAKYH